MKLMDPQRVLSHDTQYLENTLYMEAVAIISTIEGPWECKQAWNTGFQMGNGEIGAWNSPQEPDHQRCSKSHIGICIVS